MRISEKEVYDYFGYTYADRGDFYQSSRRVLEFLFDEQSLVLSGKVRGGDSQPYKVSLKLKPDGLKIASARCSCPMGGFCKHSAALLLQAIRAGLFGVPERFSSTQVVLDEFDQVVNPVSRFGLGRATSAQSSSPLLAVAKPVKLSWHFTNWVEGLSAALTEAPQDPDSTSNTNSNAGAKARQLDSVLYHLSIFSNGRFRLAASHARKLKTGGWGRAQKAEFERLAAKSAAYVTEDDCEIAKLFLSGKDSSSWYDRDNFPDIASLCEILVDKLLKTGRCYWKEDDVPLSAGPPKQGKLTWEAVAQGKQVLRCNTEQAGDVTAIAGVAWYIDPFAKQMGLLELPLPLAAVKSIFAAPSVDPEEVEAASLALAKFGAVIPMLKSKYETETIVVKPTPCLRLETYQPSASYLGYNRKSNPQAVLHFDYGDSFVDSKATESRCIEGDELIIRQKDSSAEDKHLLQLLELGLLRYHDNPHPLNTMLFIFPASAEDKWFSFASDALPALKEQGWQIEIDKSFNYEAVVPEEEWTADATEGSDFWFSLDLGITIEGRRVPLLPIVHEALRRVVGDNPLVEIEQLNRNGIFYAPLKDGRQVALPFERVRDIVGVLLELFDKDPNSFVKGAEVSLPQILDLSKFVSDQSDSAFAWKIGKKLKALMDKVRAFDGLKAVVPPKGFKAELRPYQLEGLSWLNFLREFELGGILADDMGLGKTVQTLAHIALEKHEKRLDKPFLVICPTSVLPNWMSEIEKFAPKLKVTALSGPDRSSNFTKIADSDIVVTTYPLVARDEATLAKQEWKAVILDEAQSIKNPGTLAAQAVCRLRSDYRICLTGTPIENHLGELWSQFNFLMPGFLKDLPTFTRKFRTPIEKQKNQVLQKVLAAKVRPFLLRRTKELVAKDLPEKTIMIKSVELEGAQRDLYETVRVAMYEKVKEALASKGLAKSQIIILDAMLKLRQVCCDPRLVSLNAAKKVTATAKLELLLEMIEELVAEGKKILLFSQFTSMLDLIIPELNKRKIDFVQIRGDTRDRAIPVKQFQNGDVPLFLLSLKAGGTGLNLTAADTVIHYDPWWNPAVENQATDRAHRIGQKKAVFVFKLIATGTIEERMLELQDRKKAIAEGMYGDENAVLSALTAADLEVFFKPLSDSVGNAPQIGQSPAGKKKLSLVEF